MVTPSASHADRRAWCGRSDKDKRSACWFVARTSLVRRALTLIEVVETRRTGRSARKRSVAPKLEKPPYSRGGVVDPWAGRAGRCLGGRDPLGDEVRLERLDQCYRHEDAAFSSAQPGRVRDESLSWGASIRSLMCAMARCLTFLGFQWKARYLRSLVAALDAPSAASS